MHKDINSVAFNCQRYLFGFKYHTDETKGNIFLIKRQFLAMKLKEMKSVAVYMNLRRNQS